MRLVWLTGLAALVLAAGIAAWLAPLRPNVLVLQFAFTPRVFGEVIHAWPPEHLQRFRAHLPVDGLLLLAYGAFGWLLAMRTRLFAQRSGLLRAWAARALPAAAAADAVENLLHWWLTAQPRFGMAPAYLLAAGCATLKWQLLLAWAMTVLYAVHRAQD